MLAIAFITAFFLYLALSARVATWAADIAEERGLSPKKWGALAFVFMIGLVFWDWIPMEILFKYECSTNAGLFIEKTVDEWKKENPGVWETLDAEKLPEGDIEKVEYGRKEAKRVYYRLHNGTKLVARYDVAGKYLITDMIMEDGIDRTWLNERFYYERRNELLLFHVVKKVKYLKDIQTKEILATYIDYTTDIPPIGLIGNRLSDYKFWMQKKRCSPDNYKLSKQFGSLVQKLTRERK